METAPFKLTEELVDVMGGLKSKLFEKFVRLCQDTFRVARKHARAVTRLMEIMSFQSNYPAFR
jgi:phosphatidylinositol 4-kinase